MIMDNSEQIKLHCYYYFVKKGMSLGRPYTLSKKKSLCKMTQYVVKVLFIHYMIIVDF